MRVDQNDEVLGSVTTLKSLKRKTLQNVAIQATPGPTKL